MIDINVSQELETQLEIVLRDTFAGAALNGILASDPELTNTQLQWIAPTIAKTCYRIADAMLEARKGGK
jgi:hypothetical protein